MFLALGVGSFVGGIFHLMTHAFFKACLFLGAGSVIHGMHEEQNIQKMGGLQTKMKVTYLTFIISALAISGVPPLSGFFSKDEILWKAFSQGSPLLWLFGAITALMTAFYMFRLVTLTFFGKARYSADIHPHESPKTMTVPLIVLSALAVIGGFIGIPHSLGGNNLFEHWLDPVFEKAVGRMALANSFAHSTEYILMAVSVVLGILGIYLAFRAFTKYRFVMGALKKKYITSYTLLFNKYYIDEIYDTLIVNPVLKASKYLLWRFFDLGIIDGLVNVSAKIMEVFGNLFRRLQTGIIESYAAIFVSGIIFILVWLIIR